MRLVIKTLQCESPLHWLGVKIAYFVQRRTRQFFLFLAQVIFQPNFLKLEICAWLGILYMQKFSNQKLKVKNQWGLFSRFRLFEVDSSYLRFWTVLQIFIGSKNKQNSRAPVNSVEKRKNHFTKSAIMNLKNYDFFLSITLAKINILTSTFFSGF